MQEQARRRPQGSRPNDPPTRESAEGSAELEEYLRTRRLNRAKPNRPPQPVVVVLAIAATFLLAFLGHLSDESLVYLLVVCLALIGLLLLLSKYTAS